MQQMNLVGYVSAKDCRKRDIGLTKSKEIGDFYHFNLQLDLLLVKG